MIINVFQLLLMTYRIKQIFDNVLPIISLYHEQTKVQCKNRQLLAIRFCFQMLNMWLAAQPYI